MKKNLSAKDLNLPDYTKAEEWMNALSHLLGAVMSIGVLILCLQRSEGFLTRLSSWIYGLSMATVYTVSGLYHSFRPGTKKKKLQIADHCVIYLLIAGTYTPILLGRFADTFPVIGYGLLAFQWILSAVAILLTAIDMEKHTVFSMTCYILLGWSIIFFYPQASAAIGQQGFLWLLSGGIAYTVGAILYGIGGKVRWMHGVFHIFVLLGSLLQFVPIYGYCL